MFICSWFSYCLYKKLYYCSIYLLTSRMMMMYLTGRGKTTLQSAMARHSNHIEHYIKYCWNIFHRSDMGPGKQCRWSLQSSEDWKEKPELLFNKAQQCFKQKVEFLYYDYADLFSFKVHLQSLLFIELYNVLLKHVLFSAIVFSPSESWELKTWVFLESRQ